MFYCVVIVGQFHILAMQSTWSDVLVVKSIFFLRWVQCILFYLVKQEIN